MRRLLPLFFLFFVLFSSLARVNAQSPTSILSQTTVHSQGLLDGFFAWLGSLLFHDQIPKKVGCVNQAGLPFGSDATGNCGNSTNVSTQSVSALAVPAAPNQSGNNEVLKQASREYDTAADRGIPLIQTVDNRNFIQQWWESLTLSQVVPTGNQQATNYCVSNRPLGGCDDLIPTGTSQDTSSAMASSLDCKKDSTLPLGANPDSKCLPTNQPHYVSPTPTPTDTPTPTITPVFPTGIFPTGTVPYDSCPVGNDKCVSKAMQEAGKPGDPDYYKRNKCYWRNFLPAFSGNELKARAASAICFRESGGNVISLNDRCLPYDPITGKYRDVSQRTQDFSVGLFQINLLAHCPGALRDDWYVNKSCTIINQNKLMECYNQWTTFDGAVSKMLELSSYGTNWGPWLTHHPERYCEVTNNQMICIPPSVTPAPYITTTPPSGNYVYYSQKDYRSTPYGPGCTLYDSGCGPTTLAMILSTYVGSIWTPPVAASQLLSDQSCQTYVGALSTALFRERFNSVHYLFVNNYKILSDVDKATIRTEIRKGAIMLAGAMMGWYDARLKTVRYGGHYFWVTDIDDAGTIYVMDPWYGAGRSHPIPQQNINPYPVYYKHMIEAFKP